MVLPVNGNIVKGSSGKTASKSKPSVPAIRARVETTPARNSRLMLDDPYAVKKASAAECRTFSTRLDRYLLRQESKKSNVRQNQKIDQEIANIREQIRARGC